MVLNSSVVQPLVQSKLFRTADVLNKSSEQILYIYHKQRILSEKSRAHPGVPFAHLTMGWRSKAQICPPSFSLLYCRQQSMNLLKRAPLSHCTCKIFTVKTHGLSSMDENNEVTRNQLDICILSYTKYVYTGDRNEGFV